MKANDGWNTTDTSEKLISNWYQIHFNKSKFIINSNESLIE